MLAFLHLRKNLYQNLTRIVLCTNSNVLAVVHRILAKQTDVSIRASKNKLSLISQKFNLVHDCEEFQYICTLLNFPANLLNCEYCTRLLDLIFSNCKLIDQPNDWSLLLFQETFHIHHLNPVFNHGARASKDLKNFPVV